MASQADVSPAPQGVAPPARGRGARRWLAAVLLGVVACLANLAQAGWAGAAVPADTAPALLALVLFGWAPGIGACLLATVGLLLAHAGAAAALVHLVELVVVARLARRLRSLVFASTLLWLALLLLAGFAGLLTPQRTFAASAAAGLLGAAVAEGVLLVWSPRTLRGNDREVPLWADALPRAMLIVATPMLAVGVTLTRFAVPLLSSVLLALLAVTLVALALMVTADRIADSLRAVTAAIGDGTARGKRLTTRALAPIAELREFASAVNAMQDSMTYRDPGTGLPNRTLLEDRLAVAMARATKSHESLALLHVDLDQYRLVDGSLGREAAERLLSLVARRLETCVGSGDTLARVGDDEFAVLLPGVRDLAQAETLALSMMESIKRPFTTAEREVFLTATVGIGLFPRDGATPQALLQNATAATHAAKQKGRDSYRRYTARVSAREVRRLALEAGLRRALEEGTLALHFQPIVGISSGKAVGVEALLRWRSSDGSFVEPAEFIPMAEASGLILAVDAWVLRSACDALRSFSAAGLEVAVSINLSARQFQQPDLVAQVRAALASHGVAPSRLGVEITEGSALSDFERSAETLHGLRELGTRVAIDDFGTGYSSLSYLSRLPLDTIKLDGSFVRELEDRPENAAISSAVIAMSRSLGLQVVAEGVETEGQLRFLERQGCHSIQGFLASPALPELELRALLARDGPLIPLA
jgi:diguanylate cyclase (GGDEF)-like protein